MRDIIRRWNSQIPGDETALCIFLLSIPVVLYYAVLLVFARNVPHLDDYGLILGFLQRYVNESSFSEKVQLIFAQHNEHRVAFLEAVVLLQYFIVGAVNIKTLALLGNLSILGIFFVLWGGFKPKAGKMLLFLPVAYILFQYRYYEAVLWATAALSGLWVVFLCLGAIFFLNREEDSALAASCFLATLAMYTQANGKLVLLCGLIILASKRDFRGSLLWSLFSVILLSSDLLFRRGFTSNNSLSHIIHNPSASILSFFSFLGAVWPNVNGAIFLGIAITIYFAVLSLTKYYKANPFIYTVFCFILLNALAVGYARPGVAFPSRYNIYSTIMMAVIYISVVEIVRATSEKGALWTAKVVTGLLLPLSILHYVALPIFLQYYQAIETEYEKNIILSSSESGTINKEYAKRILEGELFRIGDSQLSSMLPDNFYVYTGGREPFLVQTKHADETCGRAVKDDLWWFPYVQSFAAALRWADCAHVYDVQSMR